MKNYRDIEADQAFKLSTAEFKGATIQALQDLNNRLDRIEKTSDSKNLITYGISAFVGAIGGLVSAHFK